MGCQVCKRNTIDENAIQKNENSARSDKYKNHDSYNDNTINHTSIPKKTQSVDDTITLTLTDANDHIEIQVTDSEAFNSLVVQQRQQAIDNHSYRSTIESWQPQSLQELAGMIKAFSQGKPLIHRHWIIFYWIAYNIGYDTVAYFAKDYEDQSAEGVFRTRKGVCAGYANLYKYLCDQLRMPCEIVGGYAKGYEFANREGAPTETDHAWNAIQIDEHWYLMESTWGAGHLSKEKTFTRELNEYYFLPRPNEMIYHHLPEDEKWQLLHTPIKMDQYMQMPKVRPTYFDLNIELVSPRNQAHVDLVPNKPYALVLIRAPSDVHLTAALKLHDEKIDGGHQVIYDYEKQLYCCYFAPPNIGKYKAMIYGKPGASETGSHSSVLDLTLDVKQIPSKRISFPQTWNIFNDLGLEIISPKDTHLIKLRNGVDQIEIQIRTPNDVLLHSTLENDHREKIDGGSLIYFDRHQKIWRCRFAPNRNGVYDAFIMAKRKSDPENYTAAVSFKIDAKQISAAPLSYPQTWQVFYDLDLQIEAPKNRSNAVWADNASYAEVLMQAPDDVILSCSIQYNNVKIENGSLAQFDNEKKLWQLLFAPEQTGLHELMVFAKRLNNNNDPSEIVVKFNLNVTKLRRPMKFPLIYTQFQTSKCQIYTPMDGILKKGSIVPIHCMIPGAKDITVTVDSKWLDNEGYRDPVLRRDITVGSKEVTIYAKYDEKSKYSGLLKYTVQ